MLPSALQTSPTGRGYSPLLDTPGAFQIAAYRSADNPTTALPRPPGALPAATQPPARTRPPAAAVPAVAAGSPTAIRALRLHHGQAAADAQAAGNPGRRPQSAVLARRPDLMSNRTFSSGVLSCVGLAAGIAGFELFVSGLEKASAHETTVYAGAGVACMVGGTALTFVGGCVVDSAREKAERNANAHAEAYHAEQMDLMERGLLTPRQPAASRSEPVAIEMTQRSPRPRTAS